MKSLFSISIFSILFLGSLQAQNYIGVKGGYTNSWESYGITQVPDEAEIDINTFNASFFWYKNLSEKYQIGIEPGIVQRGANCVPGFISPWLGDTRIKITYASLPLNCRRNFVLADWLNVYLKAGPEFSAAIFAQEQLIELETGEVTDSRDLSIGRFGEVKQFNFGLSAGSGIEIPIGKGNMILEGVYYNSISHAVPRAFSLNRNINVTLGYGIRI
ncbi:MAG: outer membrane beta-barrel protein [Bacteroidota bacterium]